MVVKVVFWGMVANDKTEIGIGLRKGFLVEESVNVRWELDSG